MPRCFAGLLLVAAWLPAQTPLPVMQASGRGALWGYLSRDGRWLVPPQFHEAGDFHDGLARVVVQKAKELLSFEKPLPRVGFLDIRGQWAIGPDFGVSFESFHEGLAVKSLPGGKTRCATRAAAGFVDMHGSSPWLPIYEKANSFRQGLAAVYCEPSGWLFIRTDGTVAIPGPFHDAQSFSEQRAAVQDDKDRWGYIDANGVLAIPYQFEEAQPFHDGWARVKQGGQWAFIDRAGAKIANLSAEWDFSEGLQLFQVGDRMGYRDREGKTVIQPQFPDAGGFSEGLAAARRDEKYGYIDRTGNWVIEPQFTHAAAFHDGVAAVLIADQADSDDTLGTIEIEWFADSAARGFFVPDQTDLPIDHHDSLLSEHQIFGYVDKHGKILRPPAFGMGGK